MTLDVLIVEDEALLALELEDMLQSGGHAVVGTATTRGEALALAERTRPALAFVDIHLADGPTGVEVARRLGERGIPVVFLTANVRRIPEDFAGAIGAIEKPYTETALASAIGFLARWIEGSDPPSHPPPGLMRPAGAPDRAPAAEGRFRSH
jgi:CheY-like chemotaxis protein